jgi:uncharacterized protein YbjT (DUF2867 family)
MRILLTGATGYIGKRLLPQLVQQGHFVYCCVRDRTRFNPPSSLADSIEIVEVDFLKTETLSAVPHDIDAAYYLMHSMSASNNYADLELETADNFIRALSRAEKPEALQVIYLSGMVNEEVLSEHLSSRKAVEERLSTGPFHLTTLRAGIIIGSGSASFEILRDLVEKLPAMITPKWVQTRCQPIGIRDVLDFLTGVLHNEETFDRNFDIAGPDILTYKEMMLGFAKVRNLKRWIVTVPVMTPRLSSYWLYFVTSTSYKLATSLVDSMKIEVIARDNTLAELLGLEPASYTTSLRRTFRKIKQQEVISSWKDSLVSGVIDFKLSDFLEVPEYGCLKDERSTTVSDESAALDRIWSIGGEKGWYYANGLWRLRGLLDKLFGGVGLRRGRTDPNALSAGDAVDFWRVLYADRDEKRLLLFAEMKLPGEAWLEFKIKDGVLHQKATFRPKGLAGRLYWFGVLPFHFFVFEGMMQAVAKG